MKPQGLPEIDVPLHDRGPQPCTGCTHSFYSADDKALRYLRCGRSQHAQQCRYERHETGDCGPDGIYWKARGI